MIGFGQNFIKEYNQNLLFGIGSSVIQTSDNGYILSASIRQSINDSLEVGLYKIDVDGNMQWNKISGGIYNNTSPGTESVFQLANGNFISLSLESPRTSSPLSKIRLIKRNVNGNSLLEKNYDADSCGIIPMSFAETNDGGYIIYAKVDGGLTNGINYTYLIKTDSNGDSLWTKLYTNQQLFFVGTGNGTIPLGGYLSPSQIFGIKQTLDGGYIISGVVFNQSFSGTEPAIAKLNSQGDIDWTESYILTSNYSITRSVEQTADGGYIFSGIGIDVGGVGLAYEGFVIKTDNSGNLEWSILDSISDILDVKQTNDGGYICLKNLDNFTSGLTLGDGILLTKIDALGNNLWNKSFLNYGANSNIEQTSDGGYVLCGCSSLDTIAVTASILLIKTDGNGDITSTYNIPVNSNKGELLKVTDILGRETKQTNQPLFYIYDDGTVEKKIIIE
jgi:hypothetical protein